MKNCFKRNICPDVTKFKHDLKYNNPFNNLLESKVIHWNKIIILSNFKKRISNYLISKINLSRLLKFNNSKNKKKN
jgi:hypothetical protein